MATSCSLATASEAPLACKLRPERCDRRAEAAVSDSAVSVFGFVFESVFAFGFVYGFVFGFDGGG